MEIRWHLYLYVVANCAYCIAKPVSLNEVIAAESQQKQLVHAASPKLEEVTAQRFSLNRGLKPLLRTSKKFKETEGVDPLEKTISSLKYKKAFQIKSPLKPKRIKLNLKRDNYKIQSVKREINRNEKLNHKYVPLLRSLGMLFDNLLADSGESSELRRKRKRVRYYTDTSEVLCPCSSKSNTKVQSGEEADSTEALYETSSPTEATSKTSHPTPSGHIRSFRQNKNVPLLLPRNTLSRWRDHNGFGKGSRTTHHGSIERNLARNHGDSELGPGNGSNETGATDDEEAPGGHSRYYVRGIRPWRRIRDGHASLLSRNHTEKRKVGAIRESTSTENKSTTERPRGVIDKSKREDKQQVRRNEAESAELLPATTGGLRGALPTNEIHISKSKFEKNESNVESNSSDQQLTDRSSSIAEKDKEAGTKHETVDLNNIPTIRPDHSKIEPIVFIIDGYSVTRNKNGENKLKEKAIHIHSK